MKHYLFTNYFESQSEERQKEYDFCIQENIKLFDKIYLFVETKDIDFAFSKYYSSANNVVIIPFLYRPNFSDFFFFINNDRLFDNSINVIANTDIFFRDFNLIDSNIEKFNGGNTCFALTRYDYHPTKPSDLFDRPDSQDTWVFYGSELMPKVKNIDFPMGKAGCDNRLAYELKEAGYEVLNPSRSILTFHYHEVPLRTYLNNEGKVPEIERVPPPYLLLEPTFL